ncbi:hypothetical protein FQA39_LY06543 [Lamprigera yunnana]|nr:hypothetical protein FQA39_LY06543 [Lamprigera yunnana]
MPMKLNKSVVSTGNSAAAIAIVQGIVWSILSIVEIVIHFNGELSIYDRQLSFAFKWIVLAGGQTVSSSGLLAIAFLYLGLSVFWVSISVSIINNNRRVQKTNSKCSYLLWGVLTVFICAYDIIVVGILASDYSKCWWHYSCVAKGILFAVAARGCIFWLMNLAFGILMIQNAMRMSKKAKPGNGLESVSAFEDARAPNRLISDGTTNAAYEWNTDTSGFYKPPYGSMPPLGHSQNRPTFPTHSQSTEWVGNLGKPGSPPQNIPQSNIAGYAYPQFPRTQNPNYSPPNSPSKMALQGGAPQNPMMFGRDNRY